jgi:hypothetical protein
MLWASPCGTPCVALVATDPTKHDGIDIDSALIIVQCPSRVVEEGEQEETSFDDVDRPTLR